MEADIEFKVFFFDGSPPEQNKCAISAMSDHWLKICSDMIEQRGPVFTQALDGPLSHFQIQVGGPTGRLSAYDRPCFDFVVSSGTNSEQDISTLQLFERRYRRRVSVAGEALDDSSIVAIQDAQTKPSVLFFDLMDSYIPDEQKSALAQLGMHFGTSLIRYLRKGN